jgi:hypothetical protein
MNSTLAPPKNGLLSGMLLPGLAAGVVLPLALLSSSFRSHFSAALSPQLQFAFFASVVAMALHKVESFLFAEYDHCPVYLTNDRAPWAQNPRKAVFLAFCPIFIGMLFFACLAVFGPPWHLILITVWLGQGLHEFHHLGKSLARGRAYPGIVTSILFVGVMCLGVFPLWHEAVLGERGVVFYLFYSALPYVLLAFYLEDRRWLARGGAASTLEPAARGAAPRAVLVKQAS